MSFRLKNFGSTYQCVMQKVFDDMLYKHVECYDWWPCGQTQETTRLFERSKSCVQLLEKILDEDEPSQVHVWFDFKKAFWLHYKAPWDRDRLVQDCCHSQDAKAKKFSWLKKSL